MNLGTTRRKAGGSWYESVLCGNVQAPRCAGVLRGAVGDNGEGDVRGFCISRRASFLGACFVLFLDMNEP